MVAKRGIDFENRPQIKEHCKNYYQTCCNNDYCYEAEQTVNLPAPKHRPSSSAFVK